MAQSEQEILEGLAEIVNEETGLDTDEVELGQVLHRRPRHRLAVDDDDRRQRRGEVRRHASPTTRSRTSRPSATPSASSPAPRPDAPSRRRPAPPGAGTPARRTRRRPRHRARARTPAAPLDQGARTDDQPRQRIVVTGLGATTPLGGDRPRDAGTPSSPAGPAPRTIDRRLGRASYELPVHLRRARSQSPPEEVAHQGRDPPPRPLRASTPSSPSREAWADAGTPEVDPERLGVAIGTGIGGVWTLLDPVGHPAGEGPAAGLPARRARCSCPTRPAAAVSLELGARAGAHTPCQRLRLRRRGAWATPST